MYRFSNTVIGFLNLFTLLASIPIIGAGLWMARSSTTCESFLQMPLLVVGFIILVISLAGFIGACFHVAWALWVYLLVMLLLIGALMSLTIFGFVVTGQGGGGGEVGGGGYKEYHLDSYSPWLRKRIEEPDYWIKVRACILGSKTCAKVVFWTPLDYLTKEISPVQSGCCKPPSSCIYATGTSSTIMNPDCYRWSNNLDDLCYECDSCKAGVLEEVRRDWHKLSAINIVMLIVLICIYSLGCCAFHNAKRVETDHPHGRNRISKIHPRWDFHWWRRWHDWRHQIY